MNIFEQTSTQAILFIAIYSIMGVVPLIAALYLLLRPSNAFAPNVTPPVRLRRWAALFFAVTALSYVWWMLFFICHRDIHSIDSMIRSADYMGLAALDCVTLLTTITGTLLAMLQDRRRPMWPILIAMMPFVALSVAYMVNPSEQIKLITISYILLLYVLFTVYMVLAVRRYDRWLNDNYADLENKKVWLSLVVTLCFLLAFFFYTLVDVSSIHLIILTCIAELVLFSLLLWRVETLPQLDSILTPDPSPEEKGVFTIDLARIERLLNEHCVAPQLYLKHDLNISQLAKTIGTNRFYLSQYFSGLNTNYNAYINDLRINHFMSLYHDAVTAQRPFTAQQLALESGYRSYSTFRNAFKCKMGHSVTVWIKGMENS